MAALLSAHLAVLSPSNELQGQKPELCWDGKTWLARILGRWKEFNVSLSLFSIYHDGSCPF